MKSICHTWDGKQYVRLYDVPSASETARILEENIEIIVLRFDPGKEGYAFLSTIPQLTWLTISLEDLLNVEAIPRLKKLVVLRIVGESTGSMDGSQFPSLKQFDFRWWPGVKGIVRATQIEKMWMKSPREPDLQWLSPLSRLRVLRIDLGSMTSLKGVEAFRELDEIELGLNLKLESIAGLEHCPKLRKVKIESDKKINDYEILSECVNLEELDLWRQGTIPTISWVKNLTKLRRFTLAETLVLDGDLSPLLGLPNLEFLAISRRKGHNMTVHEIAEIVGKARGYPLQVP